MTPTSILDLQRIQANHFTQSDAFPFHLQHLSQRSPVNQSHHRFAIVQAIRQSIRPEQQRQGHRYGAHLHHRDIGHGCLKALRQHNRHPIALLHAHGLQAQTQIICCLLQLREAVGPIRTARVVFDDGSALSGIRLRRPPLATNLCHIEISRHRPTKTLLHGSIKIARRAGVVVCLTRRHF